MQCPQKVRHYLGAFFMGRKVKYPLEFKVGCVEEVLKCHRTIGSVAATNGCDESNIRKWIGFYKKYGSNGLLPRRNRIYDVDFKLKFLGAIDKEFLSSRQACVKFNIPSESAIIKWQRAYATDACAGLASKPRGRPAMNFKRAKKKSDKPLTREEELLKEIESLNAENALLKKFNALIQAEELQQQKKRKP
jgi:transposase